jgi:hypothetical protein
MPGWAPASGASRKISAPPGPAASTMPSEVPKRILRGARLATTTVSRPTQLLGRVRLANAREHRAAFLAQVHDQPEQLVRALDSSRLDDARDAQVDASEVFDADLRGCRRRGARGCSRLPRRCRRRVRRGRRGQARGLEALGSCREQCLDRRRVHARRKRPVGADRAAGQGVLDRVPALVAEAEEGLRTGCQSRHDGLEVQRQQAEQFESLRAHALHLGGARGILGHQPGLVLVDVEVGAVGEGHHPRAPRARGRGPRRLRRC